MAEAVLWNEPWLGPRAGKESRMHQREEGELSDGKSESRGGLDEMKR
jgi:hypothetical protein